MEKMYIVRRKETGWIDDSEYELYTSASDLLEDAEDDEEEFDEVYEVTLTKRVKVLIQKPQIVPYTNPKKPKSKK